MSQPLPPPLGAAAMPSRLKAVSVLTRGFRNARIRRALDVNPRPLVDPERRLVVVFSPKSACSSVVIWFFNQIGLAAEARAFNNWPHRYRRTVYYRSDRYRRGLAGNLASYRVIRVIRDPAARAASSFRHALRVRTGVLAAFTGEDPAEAGVSFRRYLDYVEALDIRRCNTHDRQQFHPVEHHLAPDRVINISTEDLFAALSEIEREFGLDQTDFSRIPWLSEVEDRRTVATTMPGADAYELPLTPRHTFEAWPARSALLTAEARRRIAAIYREDYAAYAPFLDPAAGVVPAAR